MGHIHVSIIMEVYLDLKLNFECGRSASKALPSHSSMI